MFRKAMRGFTAALLVVLMLAAAAPVQSAPPVPSAADAVTAVDATGQGLLAKAACIGCMAGILAAGGSSIIGLVILASAFPEAVALCGFGCAVAFSD